MELLKITPEALPEVRLSKINRAKVMMNLKIGGNYDD